ncbi:hypothetical protein [Kangiella japonica]
MTKVSNDQATLTAAHKVKQCDNSDYLINVVSIYETEEHRGDVVYKSKSELPETIYLIWEDFDGLVISKPASTELISAKRYRSSYNVEYLPLRKLRVAIGNALTDHRNNYLNRTKPSD